MTHRSLGASADLSLESDLSDDNCKWISSFCSLAGNEFFCEVDVVYIEDSFNLTGLAAAVPYYEVAMDTILDAENEDGSLDDEMQKCVDREAELLYGLIHARYILTYKGLRAMYEKYRTGNFGRCPRVNCKTQPLLPLGLYDTPKKATVKGYCPRCKQVYNPKFSRAERRSSSFRQTDVVDLDGAYFGTTFAHLFFLEYPELAPTQEEQVLDASPSKYTPRIFGFRLHPTSAAAALKARTAAKKNGKRK